jgi:hypothetical protein
MSDLDIELRYWSFGEAVTFVTTDLLFRQVQYTIGVERTKTGGLLVFASGATITDAGLSE